MILISSYWHLYMTSAWADTATCLCHWQRLYMPKNQQTQKWKCHVCRLLGRPVTFKWLCIHDCVSYIVHVHLQSWLCESVRKVCLFNLSRMKHQQLDLWFSLPAACPLALQWKMQVKTCHHTKVALIVDSKFACCAWCGKGVHDAANVCMMQQRCV